ncbi:MAG: rhamnan synthesis F family protein [Gammaproteobacteria bacterium]
MKFFREIFRLIKQLVFLPKNIGNFLFGTFYYDIFLAKSKKQYSGSLSLKNRTVIFLIFPEAGITNSHLRTLKYFIKNNYSPIVISNLPLIESDRSEILKNCCSLIERKNFGYDFGGYRDAILHLSNNIKKFDNLLLINDSTWFPILQDNAFINFINNSNLDFIGATSHYGFERLKLPSKRENLPKTINFNSDNRNFHYASYALSFSKKILNDSNFYKFWKTLRLSGTKNVVVRRGEIGLTQFIIRNKYYSHGSFIDSEKLETTLKEFSRERLLKICHEVIVENKSLKIFKEKFLIDLENSSRNEIISFLIIIVSRQIIVFSLLKFLIEELRFPFIKKMLLKLDKDSAEKTYNIIKSLDEEIFEEINSEIKANKELRKFIITN